MRKLAPKQTPLLKMIAIFIFSSILFAGVALSQTIVRVTGPCTREVTIRIEIFSDTDPEIFTDSELDDMTTDERQRAMDLMSRHSSYGTGALDSIANEWKTQIEDLWNGPTREQVVNAAGELGLTPEDVEQATGPRDTNRRRQDLNNPVRQQIDDRAREMIRQAGGNENCSYINCCYIYFTADVKVRRDSDTPTEGYHQIEVATPGTRSGVYYKDYQAGQPNNNIGANQEGTSGYWGYRPGFSWGASAAHETGHLMGLPDTYIEGGGHIEGHGQDVMNDSYGWPHEQAIQDILSIQNAECDCCPRDADQFYTDYGRIHRTAGDAILTNNCPILRQLLNNYRDQLANVEAASISMTAKADLIAKINGQIARVLRALENCDEETALIHLGDDSPVWCTYTDGGMTSIPLTPVPGPVSTPTTPGETPVSTPPPTGETPGTTPPTGPVSTPTTPGETPGTTPPPTGETPGSVPQPGPGITSVPGGGLKIPVPEGGDDTSAPGTQTPTTEDGGDDSTTTTTDEPEEPTVTIYVKAKETVLTPDGATDTQGTAGQQIKLFPSSTTDVALPGDGQDKPQTGFDEDPIQGTTDDEGDLTLRIPIRIAFAPDQAPSTGDNFEVGLDSTPQGSQVIQLEGTDPELINTLPGDLQPHVSDTLTIAPSTYFTLTYPLNIEGEVTGLIPGIPGLITSEPNYCRDKQLRLNDPYFNNKGSWKQKYDDQWAIKRVGFTDTAGSAWKKAGNKLSPVVVAVIDTGLDWNHLDFDWKNIWKNKDEIPGNGKDDDKNGYIDDIIGWDFYGRNNKPWDHDGHGTIVSGIIAATQNNGVGIAGINPQAKIMVLKALNNFGHSRASYLSKAIIYAADNGARIINMSVGGKNLSTIEKQAVDYAVSKGVLIIIASGNEGIDVSKYGMASFEEVITVASTDFKNRRSRFSNWGAQVNIAAPGLDVLSLRARHTDTMRDIPQVKYKNGANYVGEDKRYYRASGTSFSAPIVTGTASLILSKNPGLKSQELKRMLLQSATDIEIPGKDQYTGYGLLDASAALGADPKFFIDGAIHGVKVVRGKKGPVVQVIGSVASDRLKKAWLEIGSGESPKKWKKVSKKINKSINGNVLGNIEANKFKGAKVWFIKLVIEHKNGKKRETRFRLSLG